jgi:hypothetical protein
MSGKRPFDGTPARDPAAGGDVDNDSAEANDEVAELAKRLCVSSLSSEGADASSSGAVAGGADAGGEVTAARRVWLRGYAFWWNRTDNACNEGYVDYEAKWHGTQKQYLWDKLWWWGEIEPRWCACQGWRVNPFFLPAEIAAEQSR